MEWQEQFKNGKNLYEAGKYSEATSELKCALDKAESAKVTDAAVRKQLPYVCLELGRAYRQLSNYSEAESMLKGVLDQLKQQDIEDPVNYSFALIELGRVFSEQSRFPEAEDVLQEALRIRKAHFKEPNENIAYALNYLGLCAWRKGDSEAARGYYDQALNMYRITVGEAHKDYADTLDNMGIILQQSGLLEKAEQAHRNALSIREKCLGPEHPEIACSLSNLALSLKRQGRNENCKEFLQRAISIREKAIGSENVQLATLINNLGMHYLESGEVREAAPCFERALAIKEKILGHDNPGLSVTLKNLQITYRALKKTKEADELGQRAQALMQKKIETSADKDIETILSLADSLIAKKATEEARQLLLKALDMSDRESGPESLKVARVLKTLARNEWQDSELAKNYYIRVLAIEKKELGNQHAQVAKTLRNLGECFGRQGDFLTNRLLESQAKAIDFRTGAEHPHVAMMEKMYKRMRQLKGDKDPATIGQLRLLAHTYQLAGNTTKAEAADKEYWQAKAELVGTDSIEWAEELQQGAILDFMANKHARAVDKLSRSLEIQEKVLGPNHQDLDLTLNFLSQAYEALGNDEMATNITNRQISLLTAAHGTAHWSLKPALTRLKTLAEKAGKGKEAQELERQLNALNAPDPMEQAALQQKAAEKMMKRMSDSFVGLATMLGGADAEPQATAAITSENRDTTTTS